ncbi:hypothetical protein GCM10027435_15100 [Haloparvum alkalitolerans]|uniref:CPBP family glutamic-type intramembrane protease n=1 Tax=Haloparvum alkalitolerans TaxID=1042953 RepID=UPI003CF3BB26
MSDIDRDRLGLFVGALIAAAVLLVAAARALGVSTVALAPVYMFSPLVAGLVVCLRHDVGVREVGLRIGRPRWLLAAPFVALGLVGVTLAVAVAVPGVAFGLDGDPLPGVGLPAGALGVAAALGLALALGATVNAVFAFGEEFGWRGYLLWELAPLGFWRASLGVGALWGVWHAPVVAAGYNYPSFPTVGVAVMTLACVAFSPAYTFLVVRAESALAAALLHGVFNGSAGLVLVYAVAENARIAEFVASPVGAAGIAAFGLAAVAIAIRGAPTLDRSFAAGE